MWQHVYGISLGPLNSVMNTLGICELVVRLIHERYRQLFPSLHRTGVRAISDEQLEQNYLQKINSKQKKDLHLHSGIHSW